MARTVRPPDTYVFVKWSTTIAGCDTTAILSEVVLEPGQTRMTDTRVGGQQKKPRSVPLSGPRASWQDEEKILTSLAADVHHSSTSVTAAVPLTFQALGFVMY